MKIVSNTGKALPLVQQAILLTFYQRLKYALKGASVYFLIALATVFIPVLHFLLVPLFLIISVVTGILRFGKTKSIDLTNTNCPICSSDLKIAVLYFHQENLSLNCEECRSQFKLLNKSSIWNA